MYKIKAVIGGSYGDEGKGLMTNLFCKEAKDRDESAIVVLTNGGPQRGHTVIGPNGERHVFHHFGSGTFQGAATYCPEQFIINPMVFRQEYEELEKLGYKPKIYINEYCRITTPFDMIANQIEEENRGENKHGSCGMGIWKTIERNMEHMNRLDVHKLFSLTTFQLENILYGIKRYYWNVFNDDLSIAGISDEWNDIINDPKLIMNYIDDIMFMVRHIKICRLPEDTLKLFDNIIFENGQGLLLDERYGDHSTPSATGMKYVSEIVQHCFNFNEYDFEACYVTRSYMTRHGAGPFPRECPKEKLNSDMFDQTNVPNPFQDTLRYGILSYRELFERAEKDYKEFLLPGKWYVTVTHCDEYPCTCMDKRIRYKIYGEAIL